MNICDLLDTQTEQEQQRKFEGVELKSTEERRFWHLNF
jgi:hypothetical protein